MITSAAGCTFRSVRQNPWWIPRFLGGVPQDIGPAQLRVLGLVTIAMLFENYDMVLLANSLPQLAATFGLDSVELGWFTGLTRLGALPGFFLLALADRFGRRRLLLISIAGMSAGSCLTALAQSPVQFVSVQIVTRSFIVSAAMTSFVIISEEFPAASRGWGIGILSGVGAVGFGMGTLLYGAVNWLPFGWRALYAVGLALLFFLPAIARELRETERFLAQRHTGASASFRGVLLPIAGLLRQHPRRAFAIALIAALSHSGIGPSLQFISQNLQTERGWTPGNFALFTVAFGVFAIIGNPIAGRLGDRFGRRLVTSSALVLFPLATVGFHLGPASLVALPWTLMVFLSMASGVCVRTLVTEIFPTAFRGTGAGSLALLETVGGSAGLLIYTAAVSVLGNQPLAISLVSLACLGAAASVFLVPETARRELEEVSADEA